MRRGGKKIVKITNSVSFNILSICRVHDVCARVFATGFLDLNSFPSYCKHCAIWLVSSSFWHISVLIVTYFETSFSQYSVYVLISRLPFRDNSVSSPLRFSVCVFPYFSFYTIVSFREQIFIVIILVRVKTQSFWKCQGRKKRRYDQVFFF